MLHASPLNYLAVTCPHSCTLQKASVQKDVLVIAGTTHADPVRTGARPGNKSAVGRRRKDSPGPLPAFTRRVRSPSPAFNQQDLQEPQNRKSKLQSRKETTDEKIQTDKGQLEEMSILKPGQE